MQTLFTSLDLLGTPIVINFSGKEKVKTRFGTACSVLFFGFVIWAIFNASQEMFTRTNPKSVSSEIYTQDPREMNLSKRNFPIAFGLRAPESLQYTSFVNDSIFTIGLTHYSVQNVVQPDGTIERITVPTKIALERCKMEYFGDLAFAFNNLEINNLICISPNQTEIARLRLKGTFVSSIYDTMTLTVHQCNTTDPSANCASDEEISKYLEKAYFNMIYADMVIDPSNYSFPDARYQEIYSKRLSLATDSITNLLLSHIEVSTDSGWLSESISKKEYVKITRIVESAEVRNQNNTADPLMMVIFEVSKLETIYARSYKKILAVLAEVASLANTVLMVMLILVGPYLKLRLRETLMNQFFDIDINTKISKSKHNKKFNILKQQALHCQNRDRNDKAIKVLEIPGSTSRTKLNDSPSSRDSPDWNLMKDLTASTNPTNKTKPQTPEEDEQKGEKIQSPQKLKVYRSTSVSLNPKALNHIQNGKKNPDKGHVKAHSLKGPIEDDDVSPKSDHQYHPLALQSPKAKPSLFSSKEEPVKLSKKIIEDDTENEHHSISFAEIPETRRKGSEIILEEGQDHCIKIQQVDERADNKQDECEEADKICNPEEDEDLDAENKAESKKIKLTVWEYFISFVYKTKSLKRKLEVLDMGRNNIGERLDVVNILKKLREVDKLRALLFDKDQLVIFNNLPKPEIKLNKKRNLAAKKTFAVELLKETSLADKYGSEQDVHESYGRLVRKENKTELDERLLKLFDEGS